MRLYYDTIYELNVKFELKVFIYQLQRPEYNNYKLIFNYS